MNGTVLKAAFGIGFLLSCTCATPVQIAVAPHGTGQRSKNSLVRSEEKSAGLHHEGDSCAPHTFAGAQLQLAHAAWSGTRVDAHVTMALPADNAIITYAVRGGKLYRRGSLGKDPEDDKHFADDNVFIEALLWRTLRRFPHAPDADLVLSYGDVEARASASIDAPVFAFTPVTHGHSKAKDSFKSKHSVIGFPNPYLVDQALTLSEKMSVSGYKRSQGIVWASRRSQVFWRGSLTGDGDIASPYANTELVSKQVRVRLAEIAATAPKDFDVAYTDVDLRDIWNEDVKKEMNRTYQHAAHSEDIDFFEVLPEYKFLLNVDGVSASWRGLPLLASGGVMLLQSGHRGEFFIDDMQPWVHYVPLKPDLSDLEETLAYLRTHDEVAARIAKEGQDFAYSILTLPALECYALNALNFMSEVLHPVALADPDPPLSGGTSDGFVAVPEPDAHLRLRFKDLPDRKPEGSEGSEQ